MAKESEGQKSVRFYVCPPNSRERKELSYLRCRGFTLRQKQWYSPRRESISLDLSIWPSYHSNSHSDENVRPEARRMNQGFLPPLAKNDAKILSDEIRELLRQDVPVPVDFQTAEPLPSISKTNDITLMPKHVFPPSNGVHYNNPIDYDDVKRNLATKGFTQGYHSNNRKSFTFKTSHSPADRSMAFDVIKDTLQSEGIDEHVSRQLAERAHKRQDDLSQQGRLKNAQRVRKKRNLSRTPEPRPNSPKKAPSIGHQPNQTNDSTRIRPFLTVDKTGEQHHHCDGDKQRRCSQCLDLDVRKKQRTERSKPWTITLTSGEEGVADVITGLWFPCERDRQLWHQQRQTELDLGEDYIPPKLVLIQSKMKQKEIFIQALSKDESLLTIEYDFETATFNEILEKIKSALATYQVGARAKSVLFYNHGGPGYMYLLKGKVLTPQKLKKRESQEMRWFFEELGCLISKLEPSESYIHIMGCFFLGNKQGFKVFEELTRIMLPNHVTFEAPPELSIEGRRLIETYFNHRRYSDWKTLEDENDVKLYQRTNLFKISNFR